MNKVSLPPGRYVLFCCVFVFGLFLVSLEFFFGHCRCVYCSVFERERENVCVCVFCWKGDDEDVRFFFCRRVKTKREESGVNFRVIVCCGCGCEPPSLTLAGPRLI